MSNSAGSKRTKFCCKDCQDLILRISSSPTLKELRMAQHYRTELSARREALFDVKFRYEAHRAVEHRLNSNPIWDGLGFCNKFKPITSSWMTPAISWLCTSEEHALHLKPSLVLTTFFLVAPELYFKNPWLHDSAQLSYKPTFVPSLQSEKWAWAAQLCAPTLNSFSSRKRKQLVNEGSPGHWYVLVNIKEKTCSSKNLPGLVAWMNNGNCLVAVLFQVEWICQFLLLFLLTGS